MNFKKILVLLLACSMAFSFAGCKDDKHTTDKQQPQSSKNDTQNDDGIDYESGLSTKTYDGYNFRIFVRQAPNVADIYVEEESSETVEDAVYNRNKLVEQKYGITISATTSSSSDYETDALNTLLAGDDAYDLILPHSRAAFTYALNGVLMNWYDVPAIDLSKPWWIQDAKDSFTINDKLYVMDGDIVLGSLQYTNCILFNKDMFDELGLDYPYQLVRDGEWTFDTFVELAKKAKKDLNGDGVMTVENDRYGFYCTEWGAPISVLYAGGQRIFTNIDGVPELTLYSEKTVDLYDRFFDLISSDYGFCKHNGNYTGESLFSQDRALFSDAYLGSVASYRNMDSDFGVIPYPVFEEGDEFATNINGFAHLVCIPNTAYTHLEETGSIIEAMAAYGSRDVVPAFYDVALSTKWTRDDESSEMLDIIRASRVYDLGYISGNVFQSCGYDLISLPDHDFTSYYVSRESSALTALNKFVESYSK